MLSLDQVEMPRRLAPIRVCHNDADRVATGRNTGRTPHVPDTGRLSANRGGEHRAAIDQPLDNRETKFGAGGSCDRNVTGNTGA